MTVNPSSVCVGDSITFSASGVTDNGGTKRKNCAVVPDPPAPTYTWSLNVPAAHPPPLPALSGTGASVSVVTKAPGTYSVTYKATGNRECPPPTITIGTKSGDAFKLEITTPNGDPTTSSGANATNERTYTSAATGPTVTIPCVAASVPDPTKLRWTITNVGTIKATWSPSVAGDPHTGTGLSPTATFTGMPPNFNDFGGKTITLTMDGTSSCQTGTQDVEIFYPGNATNHPGGNVSFPNWFHYYQQNEGGTDYTYGCTPIPDVHSWSFAGIAGSVHVCDEAYAGDKYITTHLVGGQLKVTGVSSTNRHYANFLGILSHERQHATNDITTGPPADRDGDYSPNGFETGTSLTNPDDPCSAVGIAPPCDPFNDGEVYAGGPVEQAAIGAANTSLDWANPGSNHK